MHLLEELLFSIFLHLDSLLSHLEHLGIILGIQASKMVLLLKLLEGVTVEQLLPCTCFMFHFFNLLRRNNDRLLDRSQIQ